MERLFDELFTRFRDYQEAIDSEAPIFIYGKNPSAKLKEWELKNIEHIEECKGRTIDALNDYIDRRIELALKEYNRK